LAPLLGGLFILSGKTVSETDKLNLSPEQFNNYLLEEAAAVKVPYIIIGLVVLTVAIFVWRTNLPEIEEKSEGQATKKVGNILKNKNLILGVLAQFFYVGAQVCISSFFIRFLGKTAGIEEKSAALYLSVALFAFMIGRFVGTFLMRFIAPYKLLIIYSLVNIVLLFLAITWGGTFSIYSLIGVEFFMSIMFPTIFSLSIIGLKDQTKLGSSLLIMSIVGGAIFPVIMGMVSDRYDIQIAYLVPLLCFFMVLWFGLKTTSRESMITAVKH
jgi:FHS family L-fucose permease-like MFS transporter